MKYFSSIKRLVNKVMGALPSPIPTGTTEFHAWADSIASTYTLPTADTDSIRYALATMIMHLGPTVAYKPKLYFVFALRAAASKQIAGGVFTEIKQKQIAAAKAKESEATQPQAVASLEP